MRRQAVVFYVKVGTFTDLGHSKISILTVNKFGIVKLTVQPDLMVSICVMLYPGDYLRHTSADVIPLKQYIINI